jgi:dTDP-4-dehydrorhamnose 3,5-epimerase
MLFTTRPTPIPGVSIIESTIFSDPRGSFATAYQTKDIAALGLEFSLAECQIARNSALGTLRGLHWQEEPSAQAKLVRCIRGRIFDVAVDLRRDSPAFRRWTSVELTEDNGRALFIPVGCAHGYLTLSEQADILYLVSQFYDPARQRGARWNDPAFGVEWPMTPRVIAQRDASYPDFLP